MGGQDPSCQGSGFRHFVNLDIFPRSRNKWIFLFSVSWRTASAARNRKTLDPWILPHLFTTLSSCHFMAGIKHSRPLTQLTLPRSGNWLWSSNRELPISPSPQGLGAVFHSETASRSYTRTSGIGLPSATLTGHDFSEILKNARKKRRGESSLLENRESNSSY